jgi:hypothetical protein
MTQSLPPAAVPPPSWRRQRSPQTRNPNRNGILQQDFRSAKKIRFHAVRATLCNVRCDLLPDIVISRLPSHMRLAERGLAERFEIETSQQPVPLNTAQADALLDWRGRCPYNQDSDYVSASAEKRGTQPLWPSSAMSKHIRPAALRAGIDDGKGGRVAQLVEQRPFKAWVAGSIPAALTNGSDSSGTLPGWETGADP